MSGPVVFARPDRLQQFRITAGGLADGLALRAGALADAIDRYRYRTEPEYEVDCAGHDEAVRALSMAIRNLGEWVGRVGDAFENVSGNGALALVGMDALRASLPPELRLGRGPNAGDVAVDDDGWSIDAEAVGLTMVTAVAGGVTPRDLAALSFALGREQGAGRTAAAVAGSTVARGTARFVNAAAVLDVGLAEGRHRWHSEPDRETGDRAVRATIDGGVAAAGTYTGGRTGAGVAFAVCAPFIGASAVGCAAGGAGLGGWAGRRAAEWVTDRILGDEPGDWERDPELVAAEIADIDEEVVDDVEPLLDEVADDAAEAAERHADFVVEHPWLWDDEYADAPYYPPPSPGPTVPAAGPA